MQDKFFIQDKKLLHAKIASSKFKKKRQKIASSKKTKNCFIQKDKKLLHPTRQKIDEYIKYTKNYARRKYCTDENCLRQTLLRIINCF